MESIYNPQSIEAEVQQHWTKNKTFAAVDNSEKEKISTTTRCQTTQIITTGTISPLKISESSGIYLTGMKQNITTFKPLTIRTDQIHSTLKPEFKPHPRIDLSMSTTDGDGTSLGMVLSRKRSEPPPSG